MPQIASDAKISSAMSNLGMTAPLPNLDDSQVLKAILVAMGNITGGGGGGTGDVVGPASSTDSAFALWDGATGKLLKNSSVFITGGGTIGLGGFTLTVPATGTAALLGTANVFSNLMTITPPSFSENTLTVKDFTTGNKSVQIGTYQFGSGAYGIITFGNTTPNGSNGTLWSNGSTITQLNTVAGGTIFITASSGTSLLTIEGSATGKYYFNSTGGFGFTDALFYRDTANAMALRRSTNAQAFRLYGTYTDASNYVRLGLNTSSTTLTIAAETAGTGADDIDLAFTPAGTGTMKFGTHSAVGVEIVTGYITIKDSGGTTRKLAVIS